MIANPLPKNPPRVALLVLGVGRSGTSALTRMLNLLGASLPSVTLGAGEGNERGHWETLQTLALSEEILALHGSDWYDTRPFPQDWFGSSEASAFVERARTVIDDEYGGAPLIVIKEPRMCRLAPIYLEALDRGGYEPRAVIPLRHPSEMAGSLRRRDNLDERLSEFIWLRHMLEAEAATRHCPRVWTTYDQLLTDWQPLQAKIASTLDLAWPNPVETVAPEVETFLAPTLRHFDVSKAPAPLQTGPLASRIWRAAQAGLAGDEATLRAEFDAVRAVVEEIDRLSAPQRAKIQADKLAFDAFRETAAVASANAQADREASTRAMAASERARETSEVAREASETALTIERQARQAAEANAADLECQIRKIREQAAADTARAAALIQQLEVDLAAQRREIAKVYASFSWRSTKPLRSAQRILRLRPRP